jgi:hypothetical protein
VTPRACGGAEDLDVLVVGRCCGRWAPPESLPVPFGAEQALLLGVGIRAHRFGDLNAARGVLQHTDLGRSDVARDDDADGVDAEQAHQARQSSADAIGDVHGRCKFQWCLDRAPYQRRQLRLQRPAVDRQP